MAARYFVDIVVPDRDALNRLHQRGLDLFRHTAATHAGGFAIHGLLTLAEVGEVVDDGCQVLVREHEGAIARTHLETATFPDWLLHMTKE
jgi:hypothetical protein